MLSKDKSRKHRDFFEVIMECLYFSHLIHYAPTGTHYKYIYTKQVKACDALQAAQSPTTDPYRKRAVIVHSKDRSRKHRDFFEVIIQYPDFHHLVKSPPSGTKIKDIYTRQVKESWMFLGNSVEPSGKKETRLREHWWNVASVGKKVESLTRAFGLGIL